MGIKIKNCSRFFAPGELLPEVLAEINARAAAFYAERDRELKQLRQLGLKVIGIFGAALALYLAYKSESLYNGGPRKSPYDI